MTGSFARVQTNVHSRLIAENSIIFTPKATTRSNGGKFSRLRDLQAKTSASKRCGRLSLFLQHSLRNRYSRLKTVLASGYQ